jgi:hypothetical protein
MSKKPLNFYLSFEMSGVRRENLIPVDDVIWIAELVK